MEKNYISNAELKLLNLLSLKKHRLIFGQFLAENTKIVQELSMEGIYPQKVFITEDYFQTNAWIQESFNISFISDIQLSKVSQLSTFPGIIAIYPFFEEKEILNIKLNIYLDNIRDPGNLGTIIRLCDWYGIHQLFASIGTVDLYNLKTVHASMASISRVNVNYCNLQQAIEKSKSFPILASLSNDSISIWDVKKPEDNLLLVIGNESNGISPEILKQNHQKVKIPSFGKAESLNAAFATAICLDNLRRILS